MPYVNRPAPPSGLAGKFSFQYVAAIALLDGDVTVESFKDARRFAPDVEDLLSRIVIAPDPERQGRFDRMRVDVIVELDTGTQVEGCCDGPPGTWGRPADPARLAGKARDCLAGAFGPELGACVLEAAQGFSELGPDEVLGFLDLLRGKTS